MAEYSLSPGLSKESKSKDGCGGLCAPGRVLLLKFLAPAFDFRVVENLADDASQQSLQVRILNVAQGANRFLFVCFIQLPGPLVCLQLSVNAFDVFGLH